jgi:hypothetical protein
MPCQIEWTAVAEKLPVTDWYAIYLERSPRLAMLEGGDHRRRVQQNIPSSQERIPVPDIAVAPIAPGCATGKRKKSLPAV